ncbi:hypothetical protein HMPREF0673_00577 [Leyella stercorea DSM 18206]|uniref:DUF3871 family protein n=1 Tax=Leyella stercorea DSM 18206 TaxID=1002367 RepID=G6AVE2_9BACT|nr:DUF3871 family protein [Leyella stercorea]EHJ41639.1 hypothetical protein HMPREF0673_00577 [Leyella stercorea DSM 18206]
MKEEATVIASNNEINYNEAEETRTPFIIGNTQPIEMDALSDMLTPVFSRDNVETISHVEGISTITDAISTYFDGQQINAPIVRVSHEMKLRNRFGAGKMVQNLRPEETDSYFQRMMAMIEIPSVSADINGSPCHLQVCLVHNYADINLLGNSSQYQSWKLCIGFLNTLCTNGLIRSSDGCNLSIKVTNTADLYKNAWTLFQNYEYKQHLDEMKHLNDTVIDVSTLAQFLGRARMAAALPTKMKKDLNLPEFILPEAQLNQMIRDYYTDDNFGGYGHEITAWQFYMLLTNYKNNYIDVSLERSANAYTISKGIAAAINKESPEWNWFIN